MALLNQIMKKLKILKGPPFSELKYCSRCCLPETVEGIQFDEMGVCQVCRSSEQKIHIDWSRREKQLKKILEKYRAKSGSNYDCILPISGGKDSTFQAHVLVKVYGLKPLAVTFSHNWYSPIGKQNLENLLEKFNLDHIMFTPNRALVNKLARKSLVMLGDSCWHCHAGVGSFPLQIAVKFNIPLIIWGESVAELTGRATYTDTHLLKFSRNYFINNSAKFWPEQMVGSNISAKDMHPFNFPSENDLKKIGVVGIHLGDYIFWDAERLTEFIKKEYGWKEDFVEGTYKRYKSVECIMPGVHDYTKYLKRGFGRATDHASQDVRAGLMTRKEAFDLIKNIEPKEPKILDYYLKITGYTKKEFYDIMDKKKIGKAKGLKLHE